MTPRDQERIRSAFGDASAIVITAGAGMGVDSGLPDFRGPEGFWEAYPPYRRLGIRFEEAANPEHFDRDPHFGWGFYGHRTTLYRRTTPHDGFRILHDILRARRLDHFVVTSNVDGQFQKGGFAGERIWEVHGSIHHLQCTTPCSRSIWENREEIPVDESTMRARRIPRCPRCGDVARPNILMFGDFTWIEDRSERQRERFTEFTLRHRGKRIVILEIGAGTAIPTIRRLGENLAARFGSLLIRINPRDTWVPEEGVSIPLGGRDGISLLASILGCDGENSPASS